MKKIIVSGITGFVGSNLNPYLTGDFNITGLSRKENAAANILPYSSLTAENLDEFYALIHLAGKAHDLKKTSNDAEYLEVNFELTKKLYNQFLQSDARQFIYISSVKAVADEIEDVLTEDVVPNPITAYGKSKQMAETYIMSNLPINKKVYILRPCMIHGPGNKGNLNLLYSLVSKGFPWPLGGFENQRSFLSIENLCFVIKEMLVQNNIPSGIYNVADDESLSTNELIQLIAVSQNKQARILPISKGFISRIAKLGDRLSLPIDSERLQKLTESYVVSNTKIKQAIGGQFPVKAKDGLLKTFVSFKQSKSKGGIYNGKI